MTTRRTLLKCCALATLPLAGCLGTADTAADEPSPTNEPTTGASPTDDSTEKPDPTETPDGTSDGTDDLPGTGDGDADGTRPRGTGGPGVTVARMDPNDGPVAHRVEVVHEAATEEAPPGLRVSITNTTDEALDVGEGRAVVFAYRPDTADQLVLLPPDREYPVEAGCWRLSDPIAVTEEYRVRTLDPGETASQTLDLYALPGEDACLPVGEYRFETTYQAGPSSERTTGSGRTSHTWGFSVVLE